MSLLPNPVYTVGYLFIEDDEAVVSPCRSACPGCINSHEEKKSLEEKLSTNLWTSEWYFFFSPGF
jgi:hypothetical protein